MSDSPYNASLLCRECHSHVGHSPEEHARLFVLNAKFLAQIGYKPTEADKIFLDSYVVPLYPVISKVIEELYSPPKEAIKIW